MYHFPIMDGNNFFYSISLGGIFMLERLLYEQYRLYSEQRIKVGKFNGFISNGKRYIIAPFPRLKKNDMLEIIQLMQFLYERGEQNLAMIMRNVLGNYSFTVNNQQFAVLLLPENRQSAPTGSLGRELANFHKKSSGYPFKGAELNYYKGWKVFWLKRMEQLESWYQELKKSKELSQIDTLFIETFPYYLGLTENAIQYISEIELEEGEAAFQPATICHMRFTNETWQHGEEQLKLPTEWVIDQPTRDLAEYIRHDFELEGQVSTKVKGLLNAYEKDYPLSKGAWRFLYGRLLFPATYYKIIEGYYSMSVESDKERYAQQFENYVTNTDRYEHCLHSFFEEVGLLAEQLQIPIVDWL
jgi:spore coat protein YutH